VGGTQEGKKGWRGVEGEAEREGETEEGRNKGQRELDRKASSKRGGRKH